MLNSLKYLFDHPHENGFTTFVLGVLFVLSVYHFLLYFQHKDKVYLFYSLYTFLIFLNQTKFVIIDSDSMLINNYKETLTDLHSPLVWTYNTIYFVFGFTFLNLKKYSIKWYSFIIKTVYLLLSIIIITVIVFLITKNSNHIYAVNSIIIPSLYLFGIIAYYTLFTVKMPLSNYIIVGSFVLYVSSFLAENFLGFEIFENSASSSVFYIGVIIENVIFSLGLGHKQKIILQEKNDSQKKLIKQLQENEELRKLTQLKLEQDVISLGKQAENEKIEKLKVTYDKQLAELKIIALKNQMNPHFIFNSLNAIKLYIINNEKENAVYYLNKFSKLIRKILASTRENELSLAEEIETMELYINIENIRFSNEIIFSLQVDENLKTDTIKIPSLILQPFIENAIWHGLAAKKGEKKLDLIVKKQRDDCVKIHIIDNGIGREKSAIIKATKFSKNKSLGLSITKQRLEIFTENSIAKGTILFKDLFENNIASGTEVIINIPIKKC